MKFIKKFVGLTFVLSMLVVCFMSSTMAAHATWGSGATIKKTVLQCVQCSCQRDLGTTNSGACTVCRHEMYLHFQKTVDAPPPTGSTEAGYCAYHDMNMDLFCDTCGKSPQVHTINVGAGYNGYGGSTTLPDPGYIVYHLSNNVCTTNPNHPDLWHCGARMNYYQSNYYAGDGGNPDKYYYICPECGDIASPYMGGGSGGGYIPPTHTHSYGTPSWGGSH